MLGYDLWQLTSAGPAEDLNATERTQPAMLAAGVATWRAWQARGGALPALVERPQPGGVHRAGVCRRARLCPRHRPGALPR